MSGNKYEGWEVVGVAEVRLLRECRGSFLMLQDRVGLSGFMLFSPSIPQTKRVIPGRCLLIITVCLSRTELRARPRLSTCAESIPAKLARINDNLWLRRFLRDAAATRVTRQRHRIENGR